MPDTTAPTQADIDAANKAAADAAKALADRVAADQAATDATAHLGFTEKLGMAFGVDPANGAAMHVGLLILVGVSALFLLVMWRARK